MCLVASLDLERKNAAELHRRCVQPRQPRPRVAAGTRCTCLGWRARGPTAVPRLRERSAAPTGLSRADHGGGGAARLAGAGEVEAEEPPDRAAAAAARLHAGYHRELFEGASEHYPREQVSGLLLLSSSHVLHVVEACCSTIHFLIRAFASLQNEGPGALLQDIKVLLVAHSIPSRLFPEWNMAVMTSPVSHPKGSTQSQSIEEVVAECLTLMIDAADYVLKSTEEDSEASSDSLCTLAPELLIPAGSVGFLCQAEECASPVDFLSMYLSPVQPVLDSEAVWPVPLHLSA
ncbi:testis-expressed protein 47 isoform X2 [Excalfactoria chinensis]|uniref:testis-expressed protein 47 isoform X2 n=1 Tax=Excalfactoria chinensis TaxID=46218 RepID=UPI003B3BCB52